MKSRIVPVLFAAQLTMTPALAQKMNPAQINVAPAGQQSYKPAARPLHQARPQTAQIPRDQYLSIGQPKLDNRNDWHDREPTFLDYEKSFRNS